MFALLCLAALLGLGGAVPFSSLTQIPFNFFGNQSNLLGARLATSFITNIPECLSGAGYTPTYVLVSVSTIAQPVVVNTDDIQSLVNVSTANVYYAGQFNTVPCRVARDLVLVSSTGSGNGFSLSTVLGYQVGSEVCANVNGLYCNQVLQPASFYRVNFFVLDQTSTIRAYTGWSDLVGTANVRDRSQLDTGLYGRSGGMVVITVLLSIAMFTLVPALIASLVIGREKSPIP